MRVDIGSLMMIQIEQKCMPDPMCKLFDWLAF